MKPSDIPRYDWMDDRVEAYLDGALPADQRAAFEQALFDSSGDADWEDEVGLARQIRTGLRSLPRPACPPHVTQAVLARIRREAPPSWTERLRAWLVQQGAMIWQPALAMAVLVLLVISAALIKPGPPAVSPEVAEARAQVEWTLAYLSRVGRQAGQAVRREVIEERVVSPVQDVLGSRSERPDPNKP